MRDVDPLPTADVAESTGPTDSVRKRILDAAVRLFSEDGFHTTSVDEIAAAAGVAKGSIYYHFGNKDQLLVHLVEEGEAFIRGIVEDELSEPTAPQQLKTLIQTHFHLYREYAGLVRILLAGGTSGLSDDARLRIAGARAKYIDYIARLIRAGIDEGRFRQVHPDVAAASVLAAIDSVAERWLFDEGAALPVEELEATVTTLVLTGLEHREPS